MTLAAVDVCHPCYLGDHDACTAPEDCGCARVDHAPPADARDRYCVPCRRTFATPQGLAVHRARADAHRSPRSAYVPPLSDPVPGPADTDEPDELAEPLTLVAVRLDGGGVSVADSTLEEPDEAEEEPALHYREQDPTFAGHATLAQLPWAGHSATEAVRRDLWKRYVEILLDLADALPDDALFDRIEWALALRPGP